MQVAGQSMPTTALESFQFSHNGRVISRFDLSNNDYATICTKIGEFKKFMLAQPPRSVLTLTNLAGVATNAKTVDTLKAWALQNKPFVIAGAITGLSPAHRMLVSAVNYFTKRDLKLFDSAEKAADWLAQQW